MRVIVCDEAYMTLTMRLRGTYAYIAMIRYLGRRSETAEYRNSSELNCNFLSAKQLEGARIVRLRGAIIQDGRAQMRDQD